MSCRAINLGETQASIAGYLASYGLQIKNALLDSRLDLAKADAPQ